MNKPLTDETSSVLFFENRDTCKWLSTKEAARFLGITPNALRIWVCRDKVRVYRLGSHLRFQVKDLVALLSSEGGN